MRWPAGLHLWIVIARRARQSLAQLGSRDGWEGIREQPDEFHGNATACDVQKTRATAGLSRRHGWEGYEVFLNFFLTVYRRENLPARCRIKNTQKVAESRIG